MEEGGDGEGDHLQSEKENEEARKVLKKDAFPKARKRELKGNA